MLYLKILVIPLFTVISVVVIWFFIKPLYEEARVLEKVRRTEMESLVQQENDLQQRASKLQQESENGGDRVTIIRALPPERNSKELITQIENIIKKERMIIASLSIDDKPLNKDPGLGILGQSGKAYQTVSGKFEVKGSYGQLKQLLKDIRKLERIVNINQVSIKNTSEEGEGGAYGKYSLTFDAYWQDEATAEEVKSGLENREFAPTSGKLPPVASPAASTFQEPIQ